jgi:hypothetical protein
LEKEGNPSLTAMPLPRTPQLQKKTAPTPIQSGHKTKKKRKADEREEADELARERRKQRNVSPDLSRWRISSKDNSIEKKNITSLVQSFTIPP